MQRQTGYTLIELLAIVAIVGILLATSIPAFKSFSQSSGLKSSALRLATDLWLARQKAIATSQAHSIIFDPDLNEYVIFIDDGNGQPEDRADGEIDTGEEILATRELGDDYEFSEIDLDPPGVVVFLPKGTLKSGTTGGHITISNADRSRTIEIRPSGLCKVD